MYMYALVVVIPCRPPGKNLFIFIHRDPKLHMHMIPMDHMFTQDLEKDLPSYIQDCVYDKVLPPTYGTTK